MVITRSAAKTRCRVEANPASTSTEASSLTSCSSNTSTTPQRKTRHLSSPSSSKSLAVLPKHTSFSHAMALSAMQRALTDIQTSLSAPVPVSSDCFLFKALIIANTPESGYGFCCAEKHGFVIYDKVQLIQILHVYTNIKPQSSTNPDTFRKSNQLYFDSYCQCPNMRHQQSRQPQLRTLFYKFRQPFDATKITEFLQTKRKQSRSQRIIPPSYRRWKSRSWMGREWSSDGSVSEGEEENEVENESDDKEINAGSDRSSGSISSSISNNTSNSITNLLSGRTQSVLRVSTNEVIEENDITAISQVRPSQILPPISRSTLLEHQALKDIFTNTRLGYRESSERSTLQC